MPNTPKVFVSLETMFMKEKVPLFNNSRAYMSIYKLKINMFYI